MGSHCIDLLEMFFGKVKEVSCFTASLTHKYPVEDTATVLLKFSSGAQGVVDNCFNIPDSSSKNVLELYGTRGGIFAQGTIGQSAAGNVTTCLEREQKGYENQQERTGSSSEEIKVEPINIYQAEIEHFSECIEKNLDPLISGEDGLWSQKIISACYESTGTGKKISL